MSNAATRLLFGATLFALGALAAIGGLYLFRQPTTLDTTQADAQPSPERELAEKVWSGFRGRESDFASVEEFYNAYFKQLSEKTGAMRRDSATTAQGPPTGVWTERHSDARTTPLDSLSALPYLGGYSEASSDSGLVFYAPEKSYPGYNLFVSGHGPEALLMDMEGQVVHRWSYRQEDAFPDLEHLHGRSSGFFRSARLFENGDLLVVFDYLGAIRLSATSELLWSHDRAHHETDVDEEGRIYLLTSDYRSVPRWNSHGLFIEDYIDILSPDGVLEKRISIREAVENSPYANVLTLAAALQTGSAAEGKEAPPTLLDLLHTNAVDVFDGTQRWMSPLFAKGKILVSMRSSSTIAIIDPATERVEWALSGPWMFQHASVLLPNGRMMLFDNDFQRRRRSRVVEFDPFSQRIHWQFAGGPDTPLYSRVCGAAQRLANGNTLITDSESGRAIELTADYELAWAWVSPYTAGEDDRFIALLPQMQRLDPEFPVGNFIVTE